MDNLKSAFLLCFVLQALILLPSSVHSKDEDEDTLLQGLNSYRQSQSLPILAKHDKAGCLADRVANKLEDQPCPASGRAASPVVQLSDYPEAMDKCGVDINKTREGVVLPVCVRKLVPTLVLTNYTQTQYARYLNDSRFIAAGLGSEDDWMVVVLTTPTPGGSFAGAHRLFVGLVGGVRCLVSSLLVGMLLWLVA